MRKNGAPLGVTGLQDSEVSVNCLVNAGAKHSGFSWYLRIRRRDPISLSRTQAIKVEA